MFIFVVCNLRKKIFSMWEKNVCLLVSSTFYFSAKKQQFGPIFDEFLQVSMVVLRQSGKEGTATTNKSVIKSIENTVHMQHNDVEKDAIIRYNI